MILKRFILRMGPRVGAVLGYLSKEDILLILSILIMGLQLLYDYLKDRE